MKYYQSFTKFKNLVIITIKILDLNFYCWLKIINKYILLEQELKTNPDLLKVNHEHIKEISPFAFPIVCKSKELRFSLPYVGRVRSVRDATNAKDILGWKPRPAEESIIEIAEQIRELGLIK